MLPIVAETPFVDPEQSSPADYALMRRTDSTYLSKTFALSSDIGVGAGNEGKPARIIYKVFDLESGKFQFREADEWVVRVSPQGRSQVKLVIYGDHVAIQEIIIQRVDRGSLQTLLRLEGRDARRFVELIEGVSKIPVEGGETVRVDSDLLRAVTQDPSAIRRLYNQDRESFRRTIAEDSAANDLIALARRKEQVSKFRRLIYDDDFFDREVSRAPGSQKERVWQDFFEENKWVFGVGLATPFLTSWNNEKLEQVVAGYSVLGKGKRADGLLRTAEAVSSVVFAEIKTHRTPLLRLDRRSGCWSPSTDLSDAIAQVQGTVSRMISDVEVRIQAQDAAGYDIPNDFSYLVRPKSFLVVGQLSEIVSPSGGVHRDKFRSFELYRRNLMEPEIVTFDALLERAERIVELLH